MTSVRVLSVASEAYPLIKTGGLGDVVGALPPVLPQEGITVRTLIPGYTSVMNALSTAQPVHEFANFHGASARLLAVQASGMDFFVLDAPHRSEERRVGKGCRARLGR